VAHTPLPRQSEKFSPIVVFPEQGFFVLLPAKMLRQRPDCGISKEVNNGNVSLEEFLQPTMNLDNVDGPAAEVKEIVMDTYIFKLKYLLPGRGDDLFQLSLGHYLRRGASMV
jgi:hypothetical protein